MTTSAMGTTFDWVCDLVRREAGIALDSSKNYLVSSRLLPVAQRGGFKSVDEMVDALRAGRHAQLRREVVEAMTTNETSFFRDKPQYDMIRTKLVPELMEKRRAKRELQFWSAACSSGQEAYTLAIMLRESFPELAGWRIRILATDINTEMLERVRQGLFTQTEINRGLPIQLVMKYFKQQGRHWQIAEELRKMIETRQYNLVRDPPPLRDCDLVFLRNVLIYFEEPTKRRILKGMRSVLMQGGFLFLGGTETALVSDHTYEPVREGRAVCYTPR